jgi:hypothetical protein
VVGPVGAVDRRGGVVTWQRWNDNPLSWGAVAVEGAQHSGTHRDQTAPRSWEYDPDYRRRAAIKETIWHASLLAFLPPAFVLALGSALVWAFKDFR